MRIISGHVQALKICNVYMSDVEKLNISVVDNIILCISVKHTTKHTTTGLIDKDYS